VLFHHAGGLTEGVLAHLFAEPGHPDYDESAARLATERLLAFLARLPQG
jgi:dienelactone hydrolase